MQRAGGERRAPITVENGAGVVVIGDGNHVVNHQAPAVRSAYREQVRRIAPPELVGREAELAELVAFCRADSGPLYVWWRAEAWAGKTALLSWFALDPPPGVRIVPFFVTARLGAQNDVAAYTDVVLEQLVELAGEGLPALLTAATREAHLLRLYASAAEACAARGERLVLLVDGLDEDRGVTTGPDAHSIASLLPHDLRVIVSGRLNPPLPVDVPEHHPLRDPEAVRLLTPSPQARAIRTEAERELKRLLEAGGLPYDLLALLTAAGGGLTADDLAELTDAVPYRVRDVLRTGPGRTFAVRGDAYVLAHEELAAEAREMLGERELARRRAVLYAWADRWRERGWPDGTPDYLLHGYVSMLTAAADAGRLTACAADDRRHARLLAATGSDTAALAEIGTAEDAVLGATGLTWTSPSPSPSPETSTVTEAALRLALGRSKLVRDRGSVPLALLSGWAAAGMTDRAVALARSLKGEEAVQALCTVAGKLLDVGVRAPTRELVDEADELTDTLTDHDFYRWMASAVSGLFVRLGAYDRAEHRLRAIGTEGSAGSRRALVDGLLAEGRFDEAVAMAWQEPDDGPGVADLRACTVESLVRAGRFAEAEREAHRPAYEPGARAVVLLRASVALRGAGHPGAADVALREAMVERQRMGPRKSGVFLSPLIHALVAAGELAAAREDSADGGASAFAVALFRHGHGDEARGVLGTLEGSRRTHVRALAARELALAGAVEEALALAPEGETYRADPWPAIASALLARGDVAAVAPLCGRLVEGPAPAWSRVGVRSERSQVLGAFLRRLVTEGASDRARVVVDGIRENTEAVAVFAEVLHGAGRTAEARGLLAAEERRVRRPPRAVLAGDLLALAGALAEAGRRDDALRLFRSVEGEPGLDPRGAVPAALAMGRVEWAEKLLRERTAGGGEGTGHTRQTLFPRIVAAYVAEGEFEPALRLVGDEQAPPVVLAEAPVAFAEAGAWDQALDLAELASTQPRPADKATLWARMAHACVRQGRPDAARVMMEAMGEALPKGRAVPLDAVRVHHALGERAKASFAVTSLMKPRVTAAAAPALVVTGAYDEALAVFREKPSHPSDGTLVALVTELLRAEQYGRAAALLDDMHHRGPPCGEAYALLARAEPDPVRARRWAVLALRLGEWRDVLPAVLAVTPEAVPLVLDEADRLRRALEV
ncbi:hypothetical protein ACWGQ4_12720 [Streptomyces sp. NPDC055721]|uniref:hypothetical protein n=1 Tax=Streptomyces sp. NPDC127132 TaxID=3345374 RepID=UPI003643B034